MSSWEDQFIEMVQQRAGEDFVCAMANFWLEEEDYNRQRLYERKLRVVTLYQPL